MTEPTGKGVIHRGMQKNVQFICCSEPGCPETMNVPIKGTVKPGDVILNMARRRGWNIEGDGRKVRICPKHKEAKMAQKNPELVAASQKLVPLSESLKLLTDAARAQRRRVFHEIEECYGDRQYKAGFSDAYVATKLVVAVNMVADVREMNFGPAGPDPRITTLREQIAGLETRISQIEEAALAIMDQAETRTKELQRDIASLLDKINKLEGSL